MKEKEARIGVFLCRCGINIGGVINIPELREFCNDLPDVVYVTDSEFLCSSIGQNLIKEAAGKFKLNRILIAACSPKMHEITFRTLLKETNINPYLLEIVNLREQCSWCHQDDPEAATEKAKELIKALTARLKQLEPLPATKVDIIKSTLVIGGGIAGMRAALDISKRGFPVYLLEREPFLGGHVVQHNVLYPDRSNPLDIYEKYVKEIENQNLEIIADSELDKIDGYIGNFTATIKKRPNFVSNSCNLCGECEKACPVEVEN